MITEVIEKKTYTVEEYMALPDDDKQYELVKGELIEMAGPSISHGLVILNLSGYLKTFLNNNPIGQGFSGTAFELSKDSAPVPDVAFVELSRLIGVDYFDAFPGAPDLAVEVVSRTDYIFRVDDKIDEYLAFGVKLVWIINPRRKLVFIYRPEEDKPIVLGIKDELDGENVIPGFKLAISKLFE